MVVGEGPGEHEVEEGEGFVGTSGQFLRRHLRRVLGAEDADRRMCGYTNSVHCRPPDNRTPTAREYRACLNQYVKDDVRGYPFVLLVGATAVHQFYPGVRTSKLRGSAVVHPDYPGQRFVAVYHPAWALRDRAENEPRFVAQMDRLGRIMSEPQTPAWRIVRGAEGLRALARMALEAPLWSFDMETDGLRAWHPATRMLSLAVCVDDAEAAFFHRDDPEWDEALRIVSAGLRREDGSAVLGHNVGFDLDMMERRAGAEVRCGIRDTQALLRLAVDRRMVGLKQAASDYLDGYRWMVHEPHRCEDPEALAAYNTEDVVRTLQLHRRFLPELRPATRDLYERVAAPAALAVTRMGSDGIGYDLDVGAALDAHMKGKVAAALDAWRAEDPRFDPRGEYTPDNVPGGRSLTDYMYGPDGLALPVTRRTEKSDEPATDADTIKVMVRDVPAAAPLRHLLEIKKVEKRRNTFVEPYTAGKHIAEDGRVHPSYTTTKTDTGRPSSFDPNVQNVVRNDPKEPINPREGFVPRPGHLFLQGDLSQIELRLGMVLSRDPVGIAAYRSGSDLHHQTAAAIVARQGRDAASVTKEERTSAKISNFSLLFRGDAGTFQRYAFSNFGMSYTWDEAQEFVDVFFGTYRRLRPWHDEVVADLRRNRGWLVSVVGHPTFYPDWDSRNQGAREHAERAAINMTCQGPNGYFTLYALYLAQQEIRRRELVGTILTCNEVHDSVMLDVPPNMVEEGRDILATAVDGVYDWIRSWFCVPLVMDFEVGRSWGKLHEIHGWAHTAWKEAA